MSDDSANDAAAIAAKLTELLTAIRGYDDPRRATAEWKQALKLLQKTDVPSVQAVNIVAGRDVFRLAQVVEQLAGPPPAAPADVPDGDTLRKAFHAFRKRLALARLDDESRLGHSPLSTGAGSGITAIMPPVEWPQTVWDELARQGRLRHVGQGLYELAKNPPPEF